MFVRHLCVTTHLVSDPLGGRTMTYPGPPSGWTADEAVTRLFVAHYRPLVRLATLLLRDQGAAEEIVQDGYVALHDRWSRLRDPDRALGYLRTSVVNRCRSALRHRRVAAVYVATNRPGADMPSAESGALDLLRHDEVITALRALPPRQREAVVLRYYVELSEAETAELMRVSRGAVKSHTFRGLAALKQSLGAQR
ncbi:SigE family RNA polymerase sigma factor [Plantactinospora sp. B24E8]|uniref:SigE family RNA polymerase sigma factor n=1 Tax=Plantactinospora sp. B24E8 TaxID=3153567 RepID=UPI00325E5652